jgi:SagB-type dehydrogenase family enzyme
MTIPSITKEAGRYFLTDRIREEVDWWDTPQSNGEAPPPTQKTVAEGAVTVPLPRPEECQISPCNLADAITRRESHRKFLPEPLTLEELSFLLWSTQGVRRQLHEAAVLRTVPSAGCRHPFETYLVVLNIETLLPCIYRYLPLDHALVREREPDNLKGRIAAAVRGQRFAAEAAVTFIWSAIPSRTEWRYAEASYKVIALDAGHVCQNLYLACEAIQAGTCAIAAYDQNLADKLIGVDGKEEFCVYIAPVGKVG